MVSNNAREGERYIVSFPAEDPMRAALIVLALALGLAARADPPAARISDAAWLAGYWQGEGMGGTIEDLWMPPAGGAMLGAFRLVRADGKPGFYELFAIEEHASSLRFVVKHFHPNWVGWEEKDKYVSLELTRMVPGELVFGGIAFRKEGEGILLVELAIRMKDGATRQESLRFRKKAL
jgi:hypothetical protein